MVDFLSRPSAAFAGTRLIARGALADVAMAVREAAADGGSDPILVFDEEAAEVIDFDLSGDTAAFKRRLAEQARRNDAEEQEKAERPRQGRGRPRLGVVAREVTLLPRHWQWLAAQPGGASQALRRLVDGARRADAGKTEARARRESAYGFMAALAGDMPGFEEATRALFASDRARFAECIADWPADVHAYALALAFGPES